MNNLKTLSSAMISKFTLMLILSMTICSDIKVSARDFMAGSVWFTVIDEQAKTVKTKDGTPTGGAASYPSGKWILSDTLHLSSGNWVLVEIGDYSFKGCTTLQGVKIPNTVKKIGNGAFDGCSGLEIAVLPDSLEEIGYRAFACDNLKNINFPKSIGRIGEAAFRVPGLTEVNISKETEYIGLSAFSCPNLTAINVDKDNPRYYSKDGVLYDKEQNMLMEFPKSSPITSFVVDESTRKLEEYAFSGCSKLQYVSLPATISLIPKGAFLHCQSLREVYLPDFLTRIGEYAFNGCKSLTNISLPNSLRVINGSAFSDCSSLEKIIIPPSVSSMGEYVFKNCSSLEYVYFGGGLISNFENIFDKCPSLESIVIGSSSICSLSNLASKPTIYVENISLESYKKDSSWKNYDIQSIDSHPAHRRFTVAGMNYRIIDEENSIVETAECDTESQKRYTDIQIPAYVYYGGEKYTVERIGAHSFMDLAFLKSITLPATITSIGAASFAKCNSLEYISLPEDVLVINQAAFGNCPNLISVDLPNRLMWIDDRAFYNCTSLTSMTFPETLLAIYPNAFLGCTNLSKIYFERKEITEAFGDRRCFSISSSFKQCPSLSEIHLNCPIPPLTSIIDWDDDVFSHVTLYLPDEYRDAYKESYFWSKFYKISSGIENIGENPESTPAPRNNNIYTLQGRLVKINATKEDINSLAPGIYIINGKKIYAR